VHPTLKVKSQTQFALGYFLQGAAQVDRLFPERIEVVLLFVAIDLPILVVA
jgi:hypothetical protein